MSATWDWNQTLLASCSPSPVLPDGALLHRRVLAGSMDRMRRAADIAFFTRGLPSRDCERPPGKQEPSPADHIPLSRSTNTSSASDVRVVLLDSGAEALWRAFAPPAARAPEREGLR